MIKLEQVKKYKMFSGTPYNMSGPKKIKIVGLHHKILSGPKKLLCTISVDQKKIVGPVVGLAIADPHTLRGEIIFNDLPM